MSSVSRRETPAALPRQTGDPVRVVRPRLVPSLWVDRPNGRPRPQLSAEQRLTVGRAIIAVGCVYEVLALWHPRWPTISEMVYRASNHKVLRFAAWCFGGYALDHFFGS
jgi:hypothetical protein